LESLIALFLLEERMEREKIIRERFKVFQTLIGIGYNTDKKILDLKVEELVLKTNMNRSDLAIAIGLKNALANRSLVTFLCGLEEVSSSSK